MLTYKNTYGICLQRTAIQTSLHSVIKKLLFIFMSEQAGALYLSFPSFNSPPFGCLSLFYALLAKSLSYQKILSKPLIGQRSRPSFLCKILEKSQTINISYEEFEQFLFQNPS